ncbi:Spy/CpxP family protein refolding chaperone [Siccirubricoccus phaeus]|uniref:Spy/CpxP family protein refolding chaperone n=1 Tax=Siccirubricoccus phaeus TaxID=2595053 RepID=UPI0011F3D5F8|nr:periplasmic heavy metal sensor [Siccirubricoccus phaeus]
MTLRSALLVLPVATAFAAAPASAQHHHGGHGQPAPSPYAGMQARPVKALSDQQLADLRAGRGMGMALPAELNGYPGPLHVLELADALGLTPEQRERVRSLREAMTAEAVPLGERLIAEEAALDREFASRTVTPASLEVATAAIGRTQAALRAAHLRYHLTMVEVLTPEQVRRYGELRGYGSGAVPRQGGEDGGGKRPEPR